MKNIILTLLALCTPFAALSQEPSLVNSNGAQIDTDAERLAFRTAIQSQFEGRVIVASETLTSDATLETGSSTFGTDQTTAAQAILDEAEDGPITVIWDVAISCTGLKLRSNTAIRALPGCGAILRSSSNKPLLANYNPSASTVTDKNIVIEGGIWNGNAANQSHDTVGEGWIVGIRMMGVDRVTLRNLEVRSARTFAVHFANWTHVTCTDILIDNYQGTYNHDGLHFNGPGQYGLVRGLVAYVDDDALALNANDITSQSDGSGSAYGPYAGAGEIKDFTAEGIHLMNGKSGIRILSSSARIDRVQIRGVTGRAQSQAVIIDSYSEGNWRMGPPGLGNVGSVTIDGVDAVLTGSGYKQCLIWVQTDIEQLRLSNVTRNDFSQALPTLKIGADANIGQLQLDGWLSMVPLPVNNANAANQITNAGRIGSFTISNSNLARTDGAASGSPIQNTGTIRQFQAHGVQSGGWSALLNNTGTISTDNSADSTNDALASYWTIESGFGGQNPYLPANLYMAPPLTTAKVAYVTASDAFSGNVKVSAVISNMLSSTSFYLFARGNIGRAVVRLDVLQRGIEAGTARLVIYENTAGSASLKANRSVAGVLSSNTTYRCGLVVKTNGANVDVSLYVQRMTDGYYLNTSNAWAAPTEAGTVALTWTDTSSVISGAGKCGITTYASIGGQTATATNFRIEAAP